MKRVFLFLIIIFGVSKAHAQFVHKIKADSVLITNDSCTAELNLENGTRHINGFLYNKGNGRTEFRRVSKINDSTILFGNDTITIRGAGSGWLLTGNAGTTPANNYIGTFDKQPLAIRTDNVERLRVDTNGNIGIGTTTPISKLHITGSNSPFRINMSFPGNLYVQASDDILRMDGFQDHFLRIRAQSFHPGLDAGAGMLMVNNANYLFQYYMASSGNRFVPNGALIRTNGPGGLSLASDAGPIAFGKSPFIGVAEFARFLNNGNFGLGTQTPAYKLDVAGKVGIRTVDSTASAANMLYQDPVTGEIKKAAVAMGNGVLLSDSATNVAHVDIILNATTLGGVYDRIEIQIDKCRPVTDNTALQLRFSSDNGNSFYAGATDYEWVSNWNISGIGAGSHGVNAQPEDSKISLVQNVGSNTAYSCNGSLVLYHPFDNSLEAIYDGNLVSNSNSSGRIIKSGVGGRRRAAGGVNGIRLYFSSGNIAKIKYRVIGYRN